jgi:hypothetical protein
VLNEAVAAGPSSPFNPGGKAADPSVMVEMMKKNMTMMVPQFVTYNFISFFFSGFVVAKVPFALTMRFRQMLQRGVDLQGLDVTYISSLSWYVPSRLSLHPVAVRHLTRCATHRCKRAAHGAA